MRATGRTTRRVVQYVSIALQGPGVPVACIDHHDTEASHQRVAQQVYQVLSQLNVPATISGRCVQVMPL